MGRPGPAPLPTHLKIVRGTARPDRTPKNEPAPPKKKPRCPEWLCAEAKTVWRRVVRDLETMGLLHACDADIVTAYANAVVVYQRATALVDTQGVLVEGRRDGQVKNPAVQIQRDAAQLIRQLAAELGLTPSSRSRLSVQEDHDGDDLLG